MFQITTRTGRTVATKIINLNAAIHKLKLLEYDQKRAGIYNPGYYQIQKYDESAQQNNTD